MKRFEIKKRTVVSFDKSAEIPSELTDNVGGGAIITRNYKCSDVICPTDDGATCDSCNYTCGNTCYNTCQQTCNQYTCFPTQQATCNNSCDLANCQTRPIKLCRSDICNTGLC